MAYDEKTYKELTEKLKVIRTEKKAEKEAQKKEDSKMYEEIKTLYTKLSVSYDPTKISRIGYNLRKMALDEVNTEKGKATKPTKKK